MILSLSTAHYLFWLGRYMRRNQLLMLVYPFADDASAQTFARAFMFKQTRAADLNAYLAHDSLSGSIAANFAQIQDNVQSVRGVLDRQTFEAFNQLWRQRSDAAIDKAARLQHAQDCMAHLPTHVQLYWQLGDCVERIEAALRLSLDPLPAIAALQGVAQHLPTPSWQPIVDICVEIQDQPDFGTFYLLCDRLHEFFEEGP